MSNYETLTVERDGHVARVCFNRINNMNSFNTMMRREFVAAAREVNVDKNIRVVVLGANGRAFSAGADLAEDNSGFDDGQAVEDILNFEYKPGILSIADSPKPWIAAINGPCAGIGYSYAMACDLAIMADNAFLYQPFAAIGLIPDGGSTWLLPQLVGSKRAYELMMMGEKLQPENALALGMVNRVVAADDLADAAMAWAQQLASKSPLALSYTKELVRYASEHSLAESITQEARLQKSCIDSEDARNAVIAFFEKRTPEWQGK